MLFPYAKSSISLIFVKKTQFSSLKKRLFIAYITKILGGIFLVCKNLSFGIVKSKIDHFRKVPCEHTVQYKDHVATATAWQQQPRGDLALRSLLYYWAQ